MKICFVIALWLVAVCAFPSFAQAPPKEAKEWPVPFKLTSSQHVMVRAKINGQGPFNFIVDTGAPVMFVAQSVGKKLGLVTDKKGWATLDTLDIEGGLKLEKVKTIVDTPFQLEGMNGMGLAGVELHGILGYTVLARFRMAFDFSGDTMHWTPLDFDPPAPKSIAGKGDQQGLEVMGGVMKMFGSILGMKMPQYMPRGFLGMQFEENNKAVIVRSVYPGSPADEGGLKKGDELLALRGKKVATIETAQRLTSELRVGQKMIVSVKRGEETIEIAVTAAEGL